MTDAGIAGRLRCLYRAGVIVEDIVGDFRHDLVAGILRRRMHHVHQVGRQRLVHQQVYAPGEGCDVG